MEQTAIPPKKKRKHLVLPILALLLALFAGSLAFRSYRLTPHVLHVPLIARCELELYEPYDTQPVFTIVFACPRVDSIRLWPFPITQPRAEDWFEPATNSPEARFDSGVGKFTTTITNNCV